MRTSEKCARKSSAMCTYKITGLKPSWNEQLQKPGGLPPPFLLLPASLLPWLMAGPSFRRWPLRPHASMNDRPSLSYQRRQQPQPETTAKLSPRNSSARAGILTLLFHGGKIMQLGHIAEGVVDGSGDGCYKISSLSNARRSAPRRGALFRWGNPSGGQPQSSRIRVHGDSVPTRRVVPPSPAHGLHRFPVLSFSPVNLLPAAGASARRTMGAHRGRAPRRGSEPGGCPREAACLPGGAEESPCRNLCRTGSRPAGRSRGARRADSQCPNPRGRGGPRRAG